MEFRESKIANFSRLAFWTWSHRDKKLKVLWHLDNSIEVSLWFPSTDLTWWQRQHYLHQPTPLPPSSLPSSPTSPPLPTAPPGSTAVSPTWTKSRWASRPDGCVSWECPSPDLLDQNVWLRHTECWGQRLHHQLPLQRPHGTRPRAVDTPDQEWPCITFTLNPSQK